MPIKIFPIIAFLFPVLIFSQEENFPAPSEYFPDDKAKVLLVGTIHFDYPGLDAIRTMAEDQMDVLDDEKQQEVSELVNYIKRFQPNKIAIEARDNFEATKKLKHYKKGEYRQERSERYQLGIRLASELGLDTLYAIDADPMMADLAQLDTLFVSTLLKDYDFRSDLPFQKVYKEWYKVINKLPSKMNLLDYFKGINTRAHHQKVFGSYLTGDFKLDVFRGADVLSAWWYNRNLRIFRNIQKINQGKEDRILIIFGIDHAAILRQLLESSPEFEFVEFDGL